MGTATLWKSSDSGSLAVISRVIGLLLLWLLFVVLLGSGSGKFRENKQPMPQSVRRLEIKDRGSENTKHSARIGKRESKQKRARENTHMQPAT
jgi:hypothetical protein